MPTPSPILFILDDDTAFVFEKYKAANHFVLNEGEWEQFNKNNIEYKAIVILSELGWTGKSLNNDYGFDIGLDLRRKYKCRLPIIVTSSMPQSHFEFQSAGEHKYNLLYGRGTYFLPLITAGDMLDNLLSMVTPIGIPVLTDMNEMLFNLRGVLSDILGHQLRAGMALEHYQSLMDNMQLLLSPEQSVAIGWNDFREEMLDTLGDESKFPIIKTQLLYAINTALPGTEPVDANQQNDRRHTLLVLEDDEKFAQEIYRNLSILFSKIIITSVAEEAIRILDADAEHSITGLLCDWRLYEGSSKKYWQRQGYEVLEYAAKSRYAALFGITSLSDTNVHSIRNILGFELHLFKKEHFIGSGAEQQWEVMGDIILQKCDAVLQLVAAEPSGANWLKFRDEYITARSTGWQAYEAEIGTEADKLFRFYIDAIEKGDSRNVFSINEMAFILKNNLRNVLIIRRVFLGIYFVLNQKNLFLQEIRPVSLLGCGEKVDTNQRHHGINAYSIMRKDWWDDIESGTSSIHIGEEWEKFEQRIKNFRNALCIDIGELPQKGLLPEEKSWMLRNRVDYSFLFNYWHDI